MLEKIFERTTPTDALVILIAAFAIVNFWRAVWGLLDIYLFPNNYPLSLMVSLIIGIVILIAIAIYRGKR